MHIAMDVITRLNMAQEARSLSVEEISLRDFPLDQIVSLREVVAPHLIPHIVEDLLSHKQAVASLVVKDECHRPPVTSCLLADVQNKIDCKPVAVVTRRNTTLKVGVQATSRCTRRATLRSSPARECGRERRLARKCITRSFDRDSSCQSGVLDDIKANPPQSTTMDTMCVKQGCRRSARLAAKSHVGAVNPGIEKVISLESPENSKDLRRFC